VARFVALQGKTERKHAEIPSKRRMIQLFPYDVSLIRLVGALAIERDLSNRNADSR
jgi:hypothetical protein